MLNMRALRVLVLLSLAALPVAAQQFRVGDEMPLVNARVGRASRFKSFGGIATDGEHALVVWGRDNVFQSVLDGKVRHTLPLSGSPLGLVWSGDAYFLLSRQLSTYGLLRIEKSGEGPALASPGMRQFATTPRSASIVARDSGFDIVAQMDNDVVLVREYDRSGNEIREFAPIPGAHVIATTSVADKVIIVSYVGSRLDAIVVGSSGAIDRRAIVNIPVAPSVLGVASNGSTLFVSWWLGGTRTTIITSLTGFGNPATAEDVSGGSAVKAYWDGIAYALVTSERVSNTEEHLVITRYSEQAKRLDTTTIPGTTSLLSTILGVAGNAMVWAESGGETSDYWMRVGNGAATLVSEGLVEQLAHAISSDGVSVVAAWLEENSPRTVAATVFRDATSPRETIVLRHTPSPAKAMGPATVSASGMHFVVWREAWPDRTRTLLSRLDWRGRLLDEEPIELASAPPRGSFYWDAVTEIAAATNGRDLFVAWTGDAGVFGLHVGFDGRVRDKAPIAFTTAATVAYRSPRVAWDGRDYVVFWTDQAQLSGTASLFSASAATAKPRFLAATTGPFFTFAPGFAALWSEFSATTGSQVIRALAGTSVETLVTRTRNELGITEIDVAPTRDGAIAVFSEVGQRITANLFDRQRHLYASTVVAEDKTPSNGIDLIPQLQRTRVAIAGGHAFVVHMHNVTAEDRTALFVRQVDATRE